MKSKYTVCIWSNISVYESHSLFLILLSSSVSIYKPLSFLLFPNYVSTSLLLALPFLSTSFSPPHSLAHTLYLSFCLSLIHTHKNIINTHTHTHTLSLSFFPSSWTSSILSYHTGIYYFQSSSGADIIRASNMSEFRRSTSIKYFRPSLILDDVVLVFRFVKSDRFCFLFIFKRHILYS